RLSEEPQDVTRSPVKPASFHRLARIVLRADRIIRDTCGYPKRIIEMGINMPRLLYESAERSVRIRRSGVQKDSKSSGLGVGVDPFTDRTGRISTSHRQRLDQKMR